MTERIARGQNVLLDIDVQGALDVMAKVPECVSVFILPPSLKVLRERLTGRGTETQEAIDRRMGNAVGEIKLWPRYRYAVVNDDLEAAYQQLKAVITAEKNNTLRFTPVVPEE